MRLDRSIIVAKKDLAEFRKNKYIMMTLLIMPLIVSVFLPIVYVVPINRLGSETSTEVTLTFNITAVYTNASYSNMTFSDAKLDGVTLSNCVITSCIVLNSSVLASNIYASQINGSEVRDCLISGCDLILIDDDGGNSLSNSNYVGGNKQLDDLKDLMFNLLLLLLIMIPVTIPTVTASYSFVGEKVNRSLEPLLATPTTDLELLVGKAGSIFAISMAATWMSFVVSVVIVDVLTEHVLGYYPLPNLYWAVGILLLAPGMCLMSILANVLISSRVNDVRVSQQIGGVLVLPVLMFFVFSLSGFLSAGLAPILIFSLVILGADAGILWLSTKVFRREEILVNWK